MKVERISAIVDARALGGARDQALPPAGESLLLTIGDADGAGAVATLANGMALRLAGLERWRGALRPGDTLRVRVLSSDPVLELEMEGAPTRARADLDADDATSMSHQRAMRLDQAVLRQIAWQAPNAAALATSWLALAQTHWGNPTVREGGEGVAPTTMMGTAPFREPPTVLPAPTLERWALPAYVWGGVHMLLGLVELAQERQARRERRPAPMLRLELAPAALGRIVLHAFHGASGVQLLIAVERKETAPLIRDALSLIVSALARAGVRPASVRLMQEGEKTRALYQPSTHATQAWFAAQPNSLGLFRVLAETAVVLLQVLPASER